MSFSFILWLPDIQINAQRIVFNRHLCMYQFTDKYEEIASHDLAFMLEHQLQWRNFIDAKKACTELIHRNPDETKFRMKLFNISVVLGQNNEALKQLNFLIDNNPDEGVFMIQKLAMLGTMDKFEEAYAIVNQFRSKGVEYPYFVMVEAHLAFKRGDYAKTIKLIMKAHRANTIPEALRSRHLFLCGSAYDRLNQPDKAMEMLISANQFKAEPFRKKEYTSMIDRLMETYSKKNLDKMPRSTNVSKRPVFVVTMARTGSSLLNQIVDRHPTAYSVGETGYFVHRRLDMIKKHGEGYPENLLHMSTDDLDVYANGYLEGAGRPGEHSASKTLDKSIDNFLDLGFIWQALPGARYIYLKRNPIDCCFSIYRNEFVSPIIRHYTSKLEDIGYVYKQHERLKEHWRNTLGIEILDVNYEELVAEPEKQIRQILDFMELPWDDRCLKHYETKHHINTLSARQINKPINQTAVGNSKKYSKYFDELRKVLEIADF